MMTINKVNSLVEDAVKGYKNWRAATEGVTTAQKILNTVIESIDCSLFQIFPTINSTIFYSYNKLNKPLFEIGPCIF
ncbi:hypothetical protein DBN73_17485 [Enterococcus faecalis]|nr:hypothetical protein [Enterococcus faecalis]